MPLYACRCDQCDKSTDIYRSVQNRNDMPECCGCPMRRVITPLHVIGDVKTFISPIDNKPITSRRELREHCKQHDVVQVGNDRLPQKKPWKPDRKDIREDIKKTLSQYGESYL